MAAVAAVDAAAAAVCRGGDELAARTTSARCRNS